MCKRLILFHWHRPVTWCCLLLGWWLWPGTWDHSQSLWGSDEVCTSVGHWQWHPQVRDVCTDAAAEPWHRRQLQASYSSSLASLYLSFSILSLLSLLHCSKCSCSQPLYSGNHSLVWVRECCRISPPRFLAECHKKRLNQGSFVLLCFALFAFSELYLICVFSVFQFVFCPIFSSVIQREWHCIA